MKSYGADEEKCGVLRCSTAIGTVQHLVAFSINPLNSTQFFTVLSSHRFTKID